METSSAHPEEIGRDRPWALPLFLVLWMAFVGLALWWLFHLSREMASSPPVLVHAGDSSQIPFGQRVHEWLMLAHLNFARIYPWVLFAPYVLWLASRFHLERERLKLHLPVLLAGGALFAIATHAINTRVSVARTKVVLFSSEQRTSSDAEAPLHSKMMKVEVTGASAGAFIANDEFLGFHQGGGGTGMVTHAGLTTAFTNGVPADLLPRIEAAMKPALGNVAGISLSPLAAVMDCMAYGSLAGLAHAVL